MNEETTTVLDQHLDSLQYRDYLATLCTAGTSSPPLSVQVLQAETVVELCFARADGLEVVLVEILEEPGFARPDGQGMVVV